MAGAALVALTHDDLFFFKQEHSTVFFHPRKTTSRLQRVIDDNMSKIRK
jgi:hypothetical protein